MQYQILHANITRTVWQTIRRITNEILGVKGLITIFLFLYPPLYSSVFSRVISQISQSHKRTRTLTLENRRGHFSRTLLFVFSRS